MGGGRLHYGDWLYIDGVGFFEVNDIMGARATKHIDVWVSSLAEEKAFDRRFRGTTADVWRIEAK
jgi:3D (Asp-Asp-Asp) domain-containing protein